MQENIQPIFAPNKNDMRKHIEFIMSGMGDYKDGKIEIAYGDHNNIPSQAEKFFVDQDGCVDNIVEFAAEQNARGRNVYVVGSYLLPDAPVSGRGNDGLFYACNSIWCDIDTPVKPEELKLKYAAMPPSVVVITGKVPHLRVHLWWKLKDPITNADELRNTLDGIIAHLGGDTAARNPSRLMRLGGSIAWPKKNGRVVEATEVKDVPSGRPVTAEGLRMAFPSKSGKPVHKPMVKGIDFTTFNNPPESEIRDMLSFLDAGMEREPWRNIGMALHDAGYDFSLWNEWSAKSKAKYDYDVCVKDWNSFKPGKGISLGTLIQQAKNAGYMRVMPRETAQPDIKPDMGFVENLKTPTNNAQKEQGIEVKKHEKSVINDTKLAFGGIIQDTLDDILSKSEKPQPELAMLNIFAALGAIFGRRYKSPINTRTNLYTVGIANTGSGKDFSKQYIKSLMGSAELTMFLGGDGLVSSAGIISALDAKPSQIMHLDEFGMLLSEIGNKSTNNSNMRMCARTLTEFYSTSGSTYYGAQYADKEKLPIVIENPNLCIFGISTLEVYAGAMDKSAIKSGELNRYVILKPDIDYPQRRVVTEDRAPSADIIAAWSTLAPPLLSGSMTTVDWGWESDRIWELGLEQDRKVENDSLTGPLWVRYRENTIKFAMIMAIARDLKAPVICHEDLNIAERIVKKSILFMEDMVDRYMADSEHERGCNKLLEVVKRGGRMKKRDLTNKTRHLTQKQRDDILQSLQERGAIIVEAEKGGNGNSKYFITAIENNND